MENTISCRGACGTFGELNQDSGYGLTFDDYVYLNEDARGSTYNGFASKGYKVKNGKYKSSKASSVKKCFQKCLKDRKCGSFQYDRKKKKCTLSKRGVGYEGNREVIFCEKSNKYVAGYVSDASDR